MNQPEPQPATDKNQAAPKKKGFDGYTLLFLGALLFMIGGQFSNAPQIGNHKLLVSTAAMPMKEFQNSVIFLTEHSKVRSIGLIINRPGKNDAAGYGGPLEPDKIYALHTLDVVLPETRVMSDAELGFLEGQEAIDKLKAAKPKPSWYVIVKGYAGWGRGQMEEEIVGGSWELVDFDKKAVISTPAPKLWDVAHKSLSKIALTH